MKRSSLAGCCVLLVVAAAAPAAAEDAVIEFVDCSGLQLSLDGADHYNWVAPEKGRVVMVRTCGPAEADCDHHVITVWDQQGRKIFETAPYLDIPQISHGTVIDAALRTPDRLVASVAVGSSDIRFAIAEYDVEAGGLLGVVSSYPIYCRDLYGDDEGITWCLGRDATRRRNDGDFDLVYRFDESGALQGSTLSSSVFPQSAKPLEHLGHGSNLGGFLNGDGPVRLWLPAVGELISFDGDGSVRDRLALPTIEGQLRARLVSAPGGAVFALLTTGEEDEPDEWVQALYRLSENGSSWLPVNGLPIRVPRRFTLVGADDAGLVLLDLKTLMLCHIPLTAEVAAGE